MATVGDVARDIEFNKAVAKLRDQFRQKEHLVLYYLIGYLRTDTKFRDAFIERVEEVCK